MSAFAHKAGLHASAIKVDPDLYQHMDPATVGNDMRMLVSELAGRATVELKGRELGLDLSNEREALGRVVERVKDLESRGYVFEAAEASFELMLRAEVRARRGTSRSSRGGSSSSSAAARSSARPRSSCGRAGERIVATGEGNGPVNALDRALRTALEKTYPGLADLELVDFKVRIVEGAHGTGAVTRVLVETSDGTTTWDTIGVDENIIAASWQALEDAVTYGLSGREQPAYGRGARASSGQLACDRQPDADASSPEAARVEAEIAVDAADVAEQVRDDRLVIGVAADAGGTRSVRERAQRSWARGHADRVPEGGAPRGVARGRAGAGKHHGDRLHALPSAAGRQVTAVSFELWTTGTRVRRVRL